VKRIRTGAIAVVLVLSVPSCGDSDGDVPASLPAALPDLALSDMTLTVNGGSTDVASSGVRVHRRTVASFNDPATPEHDGTNESIRRFLGCRAFEWSIGAQTFTVDVIADGLHHDDPSLVERGTLGVDWTIEIPLGDDGVHSLQSECDDTVEDYGGTHHSTQWLVELGRAAHLLSAADPFEHRERIARYRERAAEIATTLVDRDNTTYWEERWLVDSEGNIFSHKTFMRAAT
jgi:hypothetical protein